MTTGPGVSHMDWRGVIASRISRAVLRRLPSAGGVLPPPGSRRTGTRSGTGARWNAEEWLAAQSTRRGEDRAGFAAKPRCRPVIPAPGGTRSRPGPGPATLRASVRSTEALLRHCPGVAFKRHFVALLTQVLSLKGGKPAWRGPATSGAGALALGMLGAQAPRRYPGPSNFKSSDAHLWSWDTGPSTSAAQMSFNMIGSRRKARRFGLSTKLGLQKNGRPSPRGTALRQRPRSMS
jgi:hypothetical protein